MKQRVRYTQVDNPSVGNLQVQVTTAAGLSPVSNATIRLTSAGDPSNVIEELKTNSVGLTEVVELNTPPVEYSLTPSDEQPYSQYNLQIEAPEFESISINGIELFEGQMALQNISLRTVAEAVQQTNFVIGPHTLFGDYPPKIPEAEVKAPSDTGEIVLSSVVIPEFIIVHDGPPEDPNAVNHYVKYKDYIKNVASSEIYATWPVATIEANILAIMSFTLNRVFTEWYRNKGYNFTITSSTAFDHKWIPGRNIFQNISNLVDTLFASYLSRPNVKQPILTQYCDGNKVQCPNWMTQWGSKTLGDQGQTAIQILRHFYGSNMYVNSATQVSGVPSSWPGFNLTVGSTGDSVRTIQNQLNTISNKFPLITKIAADGQFGANTAEAVRTFQSIFSLPQTGIVDFPTWYRISDIYVGVSRIAELV